jgi:hypothetical protein
MIFQSLTGLRNQSVMVPSGTTQRNSYYPLRNQKKGGYEMGLKVKVCD